MTLDDIDVAALYREHLRQAGRAPKPASEWDRRAGDLSRSSQASRYASDFIGRMNLDGARSLLDIGCGPGTLALPLAMRLERVYGLDFSAGMLACLEENARRQGLDNVRGIHPRLDYLETRNRLGGTRGFEEFAQRVTWAFGAIDENQRAELQRWYQADPERARSGGAPMRWAFISWDIPRKD